MTKSWYLCTGGIVASLVASCSFAVGDLTLTPPKGEVGGSSSQAGGQNTAHQGGNASSLTSSSNNGTSGSGTAQGGTTRNGATSAGGSNSLGSATASGTETSLGGASLGGGPSNSGGNNTPLAGRGNSLGGSATMGGSVNAGSFSTATTGGTSRGGTSSSGANTSLAGRGNSVGGSATIGGSANAGSSSTVTAGGASRGGTSSGGTPTGGAATGGAATGGAATGGAATGGSASGGVAATGGSVASGCTGSYETRQASSGLCIAKMVSMSRFTIDATEVTRAQYADWLAKNPALPPATDVNCGWKSTGSYAPDATCMQNQFVYTGTNYANHPQVCTDWCDAAAYCAAVGKRLCGKVGGGMNPFEDLSTLASEWYYACTSGGVNEYTYGNTYDPIKCNGYDYWGSYDSTTVPVASLNECRSTVAGFNGLFDLNGNASEWENSCNGDGQSANCHLRGGTMMNSAAGVSCSNNAITGRGNKDFVAAIRCCSG